MQGSWARMLAGAAVGFVLGAVATAAPTTAFQVALMLECVAETRHGVGSSNGRVRHLEGTQPCRVREPRWSRSLP
jgi:hypothetical protein